MFERPAVGFQSLYFRWGSQQAVHQDTAFVKVSSPMEFAASWIALEDIKSGSGELEYYIGSHRLDDYCFTGDLNRCRSNRKSVRPAYQDFTNEARVED